MAVSRRIFVSGLLLVGLVSGGPAVARSDTAVAVSPGGDWAAYHKYLKELAAAGEFSGAVLVAKDGRTVLKKGYGMADSARKEANTPETRFSIGSMNKMITGVAIAQLVQKGKLSFQDKIGKYVKGFPREIADKVTLHHLLTHTSGVPEVPLKDGKLPAFTIDALMKEIVKQPLKFEPGAKMEYSSAGFTILGAIVERAGKQDYADYVRKHILKPARMHDTAFRAYTPSKVPHMAHPYALFDANGKWVGVPQPGGGPLPEGELRDVGDEPSAATPGGGAISTVGDMLKFSQALLGHKLLNAKLTETILEGKVPFGRPGGSGGMYGYGFSDQKANGVRMVGHNGGTKGYWCQLDMYPTKGYTVVILTNQDGALFAPLRKSQDHVTL
ncbi:beta-lactamase family protein [Nonomuraea sp. KC401]|uniref:serine hydrolase domain-containing protein n=1 Tax=unclassified Nonomuraea TaxID=2593643 RepID=UPI0010FF36F7|nr:MULTISPECIES: serine hydrolase domain-containing protein [unclassified Nonomuraea]NBE97275.1 serine hydrolase [Nonomuraea sp. K271]TLF65872.1 beta-lactamase family protein [Nonomuraea sp. KC401]